MRASPIGSFTARNTVTKKDMEYATWAIELLKPYEKNAKKHDKAQVKKIVESIKKFGWDQPIVVEPNGTIIKGHGRRLAAIELGLSVVPVVIRHDLSPEQAKAARLADNRVAISDIDTELFRAELESFNADFDLLKGIFDDKELEFTVKDLGEMNTDVFIDDIDAAVREQESEHKEKVSEAEKRRVPLAKAFGIKDIQGANEIHVARFLAHIKHETGKDGEEGLVEFIKSVV